MGLRHAAALTLIVVAPVTVEQKPTSQHALALTRAYLAVWQDTLASLVAEEAYSRTKCRGSSGSAVSPRT